MDAVRLVFTDIWSAVATRFATIRFWDVVDVLIVAFLLYKAIVFLKDTRAVQLLRGIIILVILLLVSDWAVMEATYRILSYVMQLGLVAVVILFQPELRSVLERVGRNNGLFFDVKRSGANAEAEHDIDEVCTAVGQMSRHRIGALIVFERGTKLGEIIKSGTVIDAGITSELIGSIFFPNSPLHDGALVVRDFRLCAAGCFLPLTQNSELSKELGTRHRAAIGVTEQSDAFVVVVSEETGIVSTVHDGKIIRNYTLSALKATLMDNLMRSQRPAERRLFAWKFGKK